MQEAAIQAYANDRKTDDSAGLGTGEAGVDGHSGGTSQDIEGELPAGGADAEAEGDGTDDDAFAAEFEGADAWEGEGGPSGALSRSDGTAELQDDLQAAVSFFAGDPASGAIDSAAERFS